MKRLLFVCSLFAICTMYAEHATPMTPEAEDDRSWPEAWEAGFQERAKLAIELQAQNGRYGSTYFENEKRSFGIAMMSILGGYEKPAIEFLQSADHPRNWNTHTKGIDFYACFTLKHQVRKYFYFGDKLDARHKQRMFDGAKIWTEKEPLNRPHHAYFGASGWGPDAKNSWVDVRNTDNLKLMRDTSVYLFAEEVGNEATRLLYRDKLQGFMTTMFYAGHGEWDSENYLGHSIAPLLNLYDFAKDPHVKGLAKAGLDFMATSLALKYYRGNYNGPSRRDYNHPYPLGGSSASFGWLWFGETPYKPTSNRQVESDTIHVITSSYRPPRAVVELARKNFKKPVEITAGKGAWVSWKSPDAPAPDCYETHYFSEYYQFGTLARGTQHPDINGFKILTHHPQRGADTIVAGPVSDPLYLGSPVYQRSRLARHSVVGQNGNVAIYITQPSKLPYLWLIPKDAEVSHQGGASFIRTSSVTLAIWPINATMPKPDNKLTQRVQVNIKTNRKTGQKTRHPRWDTSTVLRSNRSKDGAYGFAIELYDGKDHDAFIAKASEIKPEFTGLAPRDTFSMTSVSGKRVDVQWGETLEELNIWRDGQKRDWASDANKALFHTLHGGELISMPWQGDGKLRVKVGKHYFECILNRDGKTRFVEN